MKYKILKRLIIIIGTVILLGIPLFISVVVCEDWKDFKNFYWG